jgi:predicted ArsR family transcriptional regulator
MSQRRAIVTAIQSGATIVKLIHASTGIPIPSIHARLADLRRIGVLRTYRLRFKESKRGRPYSHYGIRV